MRARRLVTEVTRLWVAGTQCRGTAHPQPRALTDQRHPSKLRPERTVYVILGRSANAVQRWDEGRFCRVTSATLQPCPVAVAGPPLGSY